MEKMIWAKPEMNEVAFAANEYVAACGDKGKTYKFECNAKYGQLWYYSGLNLENYKSDSQDPNSPINWGTDKWDDYNATQIGGIYTPCKDKHEASTAEGFYWGYIDWYNGYNDDGHNDYHDKGETVIVWRGPNGTNGHATTNLDMSTWETAKS